MFVSEMRMRAVRRAIATWHPTGKTAEERYPRLFRLAVSLGFVDCMEC